ncbi:hypothetical protein MLD38_040555 [Melastoma candidum]|nr:hypothetical protein MLD38_040555 [Melastoma candidum]
MFEEFDETYAQAFGVQAARPSPNSSDVQFAKEPSRAPLSGPLVIAGGSWRSRYLCQTAKVKDIPRRKVSLKCRDDTDVYQINRIPGPAPSSAAYKEGLPVSATGGYVLQKRSTSHVNAETTHNIEQSQSAGGATLSHNMLDKMQLLSNF